MVRKLVPPAIAIKYLRHVGKPHDPLSPGASCGLTIKRRLIANFHEWLEDKQVALSRLAPDDVTRFLKDRQNSGRLYESTYRRVLRNQLYGYLAWLHSTRRISFDPKSMTEYRFARRGEQISKSGSLPPLACDFLESLRPTRAAGTCDGHASHLRQFHRWMEEKKLKLKGLRRPQVVAWLKDLKQRDLTAATRRCRLTSVRMYFRWLAEQGVLRRDPDELIRTTDFPKLPKYLPRPFSAQHDRELERRLTERSDSVDCQALLLQRYTGFRVGEILTLEYECVHTDSQGHRFLKAPLGKLQKERLVPLDDKAYKLVYAIRRWGPTPRRSLFPLTTSVLVHRARMNATLQDVCEDLEMDPPTSHRMRHTYATRLTEGGISLPALMKLLGHASILMTEVYAEVSLGTIEKEFFEAQREIERKYKELFQKPFPVDPGRMLSDVVRWVQKNVAHHKAHKKATQSLIKRLKRIQAELRALQRNADSGKPGGKDSP